LKVEHIKNTNIKEIKNIKDVDFSTLKSVETSELGRQINLSYTLVINDKVYGVELEQEQDGDTETETEFFTEFEEEAKLIKAYLAKKRVLITEMIPIIDMIVSGEIDIKEALKI